MTIIRMGYAATCSAVRRVFIFAILALVSANLYAASDQATDEAFAALLSMPGAEPETGQWDFPVPDDFSQQSEAELIAYLARKKKAGADFNAYRHFGTLLHHAIRAGQTKAAVWLLKNGADPHQTLKGGTENALGLSLRYKRNALTQLLQEQYGVKSTIEKAVPYPPDPGEIDPTTLPTSSLSVSEVEIARKILERTSWVAHNPLPDQKIAQATQERIRKWNAFIGKLPPDVYAQLMDDDTAISNLIRIHARSARDFDKTLAALPPGILERRASAAVGTLALLAMVQIPDEKNPKRIYPLPAETWRTLWRRVGHPIVYPDGLFLAGQIPPELWPELFASGYSDHNAESALGCLVTQVGAADLKAIWPQLEVHFPNVREAAPRMVLNHLRMPASNYCWAWNDEETKNKLLFLTSLGIKGAVRGIIKQQLKYKPTDLLAAMKPFLPDDRTTVPKPTLVEIAPKCRFNMTDAWYRELLKNSKVSDGVQIETVQLIDLPGETECGLLAGGFFSLSSAPNDSFTGPEENPVPSCPDPAGGYEVWRNVQGKIERLETEMTGSSGGTTLIHVHDTTTGRRYYLREGGGGGMCDGRLKLPMLFAWQASPKGSSLKQVANLELEKVLFDQCSAGDEGVRCTGIQILQWDTSMPAARKEPAMRDAYQGMELRSFIKTFRGSQYNEYQSAILTLDKPTLKAIQSSGIPGDWTADAIKRVSASDLPLTEKRKRIAWIFYDNAQLARALDSDVLTGLLNWLPREDWAPVLRVISRNNFNVDYLREAAERKGLTRLACDIDHAQGLICGEKWSVSR